MKKISKLVVVVMALVLCFSMFSGFTYASKASLSVPGQIDLLPNQSKTFYIKTGETLQLTLGYSGPLATLQVDNENYTSYNFSSGYGASSLNINSLSNGTHTISFTTKYSNTQFNDFSCVVVVGSGDSAIPPTFAQAIVKFYADNEKLSNVVSSYTCDLDTQLTNIPSTPVKEGFKFISWAYYNGTLKEYVNFDSTNLPSITINKLQNGILRVVPIFKEIKEYSITYMTKQSGFLGIKDWKESFIMKVIDGSIVPDLTDKFGIAFEFMSSDKAGKSKITATTKVADNMTVYVHLKDLPNTFEINYKTLEYKLYASSIVGSYVHTNFKYDYIVPGTIVDLNLVVPDVKSNDHTADVYKFAFWSFDEQGKNKVSNDYVATKDTILYAQYDGIKTDNVTGVIGFFQSINTKILQPMNSLWGIGNAWDYVITIVVLIGIFALIFRFVKYILKLIF